MIKGNFAFVLHSHLPYVLSHGRWPHGTDWLCEAAAETYLPIISVLNELIADGYSPKLTIGLSPVLCEQLADDSFKKEFIDYLNQKIKAAQIDIDEFKNSNQTPMLETANHWHDFYSDTLKQFKIIDQNILIEFKKLQDNGHIEIITCGATHGYYPLLSRDESLQTQTKAAVKNYMKHFGEKPKGIWLPECAYRPRYRWTSPVPINSEKKTYLRKGADELLSENGLDFFIIDSALLKGGKSKGVYIDRFEALKKLWGQFEKEYKPRDEEKEKTPREVYLVASGKDSKKPVAIYSRDPETGSLVWSGDHGYPGDGNYLDFHKKRSPGGLRYWAVTSSKADLADKVEYNITSAKSRIPENAKHFTDMVEKILAEYNYDTNTEGILVAPYDTELFGHWWYEGPQFLKQVLINLCESKEVELTFLSDHLNKTKPEQIISIPEGSWGQGNHHYIWLNKDTEWTWKYIYEAEDKMCKLASYWKNNPAKQDDDLEKLLKQAMRELMLMSASDWQFLISTVAAADYAELRITEHYNDFKKLTEIIDRKINNELIDDEMWMFYKECHERDSLFDEIEIEWFSEVEFPAE
jgi:1,4-alpha-glucan branching enzyme